MPLQWGLRPIASPLSLLGIFHTCLIISSGNDALFLDYSFNQFMMWPIIIILGWRGPAPFRKVRICKVWRITRKSFVKHINSGLLKREIELLLTSGKRRRSLEICFYSRWCPWKHQSQTNDRREINSFQSCWTAFLSSLNPSLNSQLQICSVRY